MDTSNRVKMHVLGVRRYDLNGQKFAALYAVDQSAEQTNDSKGIMPLKMACNYDVLDRLYDGALPGDCELLINIKMGAQGKAGMHVNDVKVLEPEPKTRSSSAPTATATQSQKAS